MRLDIDKLSVDDFITVRAHGDDCNPAYDRSSGRIQEINGCRVFLDIKSGWNINTKTWFTIDARSWGYERNDWDE